jgi:hypothetical protein
LGGSSLGDEAIVKAELALTPLRSGGLPSRSASDPAESRVRNIEGVEHTIEVNAEGLQEAVAWRRSDWECRVGQPDREWAAAGQIRIKIAVLSLPHGFPPLALMTSA